LSAASAATFGEDVIFLRQHTEVIVLRDEKGAAQVALAPAWQGRVMTSTAAGDSGASFGWINRELIASGKLQPHINVFGGEDRLWLGPEGGQFGIFFAPGAPFNLEHWFVPAALDTLPFDAVVQAKDHAVFRAHFRVTNWSGSHFEVTVRREVRLLSVHEAWAALKMAPAERPSSDVALVAYESVNTLVNAGKDSWKKDTGLLSVWVLGMFNPSPTATIVVPIREGAESELGTKVASNYFGEVPPRRLKVTDHTIFFSGDGKFRSKIGISPKRSTGILGSYDADHHVLTLVLFEQPRDAAGYVNSLWKLQHDPYGGDAINSYNDGPPAAGAKALGPFFEMESSSPAASLGPGGSLAHTRRTFHLAGPEGELDRAARAVLGVSLAQIQATFHAE
jgi:hypothetical protein